MSTIFNTSYLESLRRIQGERRESRPKENATKGFPELLSQLEQKIGESVKGTQETVVTPSEKSARGSLSYDSAADGAGEAMSTLSLTETEHFLNIRQEAAMDSYRLTPRDISLDPKPVAVDMPVTVPAPAQTAPVTPARKVPQAMLPVSNIDKGGIDKLPPAPKLLSVKRIDKELATVLTEALAAPEAKTPTASDEFLQGIITGAGKRFGVDPSLSIAVAKAESSLRPDAVSRDGHHSKGMFQLLDATGKELMDRLNVDGSYTPFDPKQNAHLGVAYLRRLHDLFSEENILAANLKTIPVKSAAELEKFAVAAFNAGEGNVARAQREAKALGKDPTRFDAIKAHLPASTRSYVQRVANLKARMGVSDDEDTLA